MALEQLRSFNENAILPGSQFPEPKIPQNATVEIDGLFFPNQEFVTRADISEASNTPLSTVAARVNELEKQNIVQPYHHGTGTRARKKFYRQADIPIILQALPTKQSPNQPELNGKSNLVSEGNKKPENFFVFRDGQKIKRIGLKQKALLELISIRANDEKPTILPDLKEKGIITDGTSLRQLQNLFALLNANMEEQTSWRLMEVSYNNPDTQKDVFAITLIKIEPNKDRDLTKDQKLQLKKILPKYAVRDMLDEIMQSKTDISYNVRVRLAKYLLPLRIGIPDIFGEISDQELNDMFMEALRNAFGKNHKSQPDPTDLELREKAQSLRQKLPNIEDEINFIRRMLALTMIEAKEKKDY